MTGSRLGAAMALAFAFAVNAGAEAPAVVFETTQGRFTVELFPDKAPQTVDNFLKLVDTGFYDGLIFHRVIANFVIQTGGFDARMGYRTPPRKVPNESNNRLKNERGTLSMARGNDPNSADAQFYVNMNDNPHLDFGFHGPGRPGYTVFGRVVEGYEVAEDIELSDTHVVAGMVGVPIEPVVIVSAFRHRAASAD